MSWEMVELGKVGKISTGNTPPKNNPEFYKDGNIVFVKPNNFNKLTISLLEDSDEYLTEQGSFKARIAPKNSVLVTCIGIIGNVGIASKNLCFNQQINAIIPDEEISTSRYLAYAIIFRKEPLQAIANAPIVPIINKTQFSLFKIPLPPLKTQKRIAELLDRAQELIDKRKEQIALMDQLIQSLFHDMFGDPVTNPKGWEKCDIKWLCDRFNDGPFGSNLKSSHYTKMGVRIIRLQNIGCGEFVDNDRAYVSESHHEKVLNRYSCRPGDIVIGTLGNPNLRACFIPGHIDLSINKADCLLCRVNKKRANSFWMMWLFNMKGTLALTQNMQHGQTRTRISMGQLSKLSVPVPPLDLQNTFAERVQQIEAQKETMTTSLHELEDNFNSIMQRAFKGEI